MGIKVEVKINGLKRAGGWFDCICFCYYCTCGNRKGCDFHSCGCGIKGRWVGGWVYHKVMLGGDVFEVGWRRWALEFRKRDCQRKLLFR